MKIILKVIRTFFVFLGVIFFLIIISLAYIWLADPFNLKTFVPSDLSSATIVESVVSGSDDWKEDLDIDVDSLPSEITPEMEECFIEKLGEKRVQEIKGGEEPGFKDYLKANDCLDLD